MADIQSEATDSSPVHTARLVYSTLRGVLVTTIKVPYATPLAIVYFTPLEMLQHLNISVNFNDTIRNIFNFTHNNI
jgi:hypothetical protein